MVSEADSGVKWTTNKHAITKFISKEATGRCVFLLTWFLCVTEHPYHISFMCRYSFEEVSSVARHTHSYKMVLIALRWAELSRTEPSWTEQSCCAGRIDFISRHCIIRELDVILFPCNRLGCTAQGMLFCPFLFLVFVSYVRKEKHIRVYGVVLLPLHPRNAWSTWCECYATRGHSSTL
jgi:hypothetical protein